MKNKLLLGIGIGVGASAILTLVIVGAIALTVGKSPPPAGTTPSTMNNPKPATAAGQIAARVVINGRALTAGDIENFEKLYRMKPAPGNYWYDGKSGLYGAVGQPAAGFMHPGHDLGPLAADASKGNTGVFINGREQTLSKVQMLTYLARTQVLPGRYWLDARGNAGHEGNPVPVGNLFAAAVAAQQGGGGRGGRGGDNFWSSRFSAGYVSLPGGGTVSYGYWSFGLFRMAVNPAAPYAASLFRARTGPMMPCNQSRFCRYPSV